jgi:adenosine deaminase CECR1
MTVADSPKKRKRALSLQPTRKIPLHSGESKTVQMPSENIMTPEEAAANVGAAFKAAAENRKAVRSYERHRAILVNDEQDKAWDRRARPKGRLTLDDKTEKRAAVIIQAIREYERGVTFGNLASEALPLEDDRDMGGQYLTNKDRIDNQSKLYQIAKIVPKGALLHLHFNAELHPELLLVRARKMKNMYIRSIIPLTEKEHLVQTEMVFSVVDPKTVDPNVDIFSNTYPTLEGSKGIRDPDYLRTVWMPWKKFQQEFPKKFPGVHNHEEPETFQAGRPHHCGERKPAILTPAENWLRSKMVLSQDEAYRPTQTVNGYVLLCWSLYLLISTQSLGPFQPSHQGFQRFTKL